MDTEKNNIAARFENESERAKQIVAECGTFWACRLAIELLNSHLEPTNKSFTDLQNGQSYKPTKRVSEKETVSWLICKIQDLKNLITHFQSLVCNDLIASINSASGNPLEILDAVKKISAAGRELILWEEEIRFTILPEKIRPLQETLRGATGQLLDELNALAAKIEAPLKKTKPSGVRTLKISFKEPTQIAKFNRQLTKLTSDIQKNPQDWVGWA
jgi:hypothetical protein